MRKIMFLSGVVGMFISGTVLAAVVTPSEYERTVTVKAQLAADSATYPGYSKEDSTKDSGIKIATTKYVDTNATTTQAAVSALTAQAGTDTTSVTNNGTAIDAMISDRQAYVDAVGNGAPCKSLDTNTYSGCGYMVSDGDNLGDDKLKPASYTWFKIIK